MTQTQPPRQIVLHADDDLDDIQLVREAFALHTNNVTVISLNNEQTQEVTLVTVIMAAIAVVSILF